MPDAHSERPGPLTRRRDLLVGGAGAVVGAAAVGAAWAATPDVGEEAAEPEAAAEPTAAPPPPTRRFRSTQLTAPEATVTGTAGVAGLTFTTPRTPLFRAIAWDAAGEPVWIEPDGNAATDLRVQAYRGRPVLTYWSGEVKEGTGNGKGVVLDESYSVVAEVRAGHGVLHDLHEFQLTERGTALLTSYPTLPRDLSSLGGPADGWVWGARVQEVDVETGEVLLDWEGLDHLELDETYQKLEEGTGTPDAPFDPIHVNSVAEDGDALLVCARHTFAVYRVDRRTGEVLWRFGGRRSDITVPEGGEFAWQHDARRQPDGTLTVYDNHEHLQDTDAVSAALRFRIDEQARTAELVQALRHEDRYGYAMGNAQWLDGGHVLVGWGMDPHATEFDADGRVVWELGGLGLGSYRSYRAPWRGRPTTSPDVAAVDGAAFVSWNGATEVARWRLRAGSGDAVGPVLATVARDGFETRIEIEPDPHVEWVRAEALDRGGRVLGRSRAVRV